MCLLIMKISQHLMLLWSKINPRSNQSSGKIKTVNNCSKKLNKLSKLSKRKKRKNRPLLNKRPKSLRSPKFWTKKSNKVLRSTLIKRKIKSLKINLEITLVLLMLKRSKNDQVSRVLIESSLMRE